MGNINNKIKLDLDIILKTLYLNDIEELEMKISGQEKEIKKRILDIKNKKIKLLSENEIFEVSR